MNNRYWTVWSHEHNGYWPTNRRGYVNSLQHAGRFTFEEALSICLESNLGMKGSVPEETMFPFPTGPEDSKAQEKALVSLLQTWLSNYHYGAKQPEEELAKTTERTLAEMLNADRPQGD